MGGSRCCAHTPMPVSYRHPARPLSPFPAITDADDSIVLSDIVRTGEASRLRRRGAIRDPPSSSTHRALPSMSIPPPSTNPTARAFPAEPLSPPRAQVPGTPPPQWYSYRPAAWADADAAADPYSGQYLDDDDDEAGGASGEWVWARRASGEGADLNGSRETLEAEVRLEDSDQAAGSYMLFCGGDLPDSDFDYEHNHDYDYDHDHPAHPAPPRRRASAFGPAPAPARRGPKPRRTNGCGALVHTVALPRRRHGVWIARGTAGPAVGPMDAEYFDCKAVAKMMQSACGCIREGVGCRVW